MNLRRVHWLFMARNREFYRDRASLAWNLLFPILMVAGIGLLFDGRDTDVATVGVLSPAPAAAAPADYRAFRALRHVRFVDAASRDEALDRLRRRRLDLVVDARDGAVRYWVDASSPRGYVAERLLLGAAAPASADVAREAVVSRDLPYTAWMFPGLLALNVMWMSLYGVGFSIVRYRQNGVLKRYRATPVTAFEYLAAQVLSRLVIVVLTAAAVCAGCAALFGMQCAGSWALFGLTLLLGTLSATSIGLVVASRSASTELVSGVLNFIAPMMMLLGGVWFSTEAAPAWVRALASALPLTHCVDAARRIMNDGAGLSDVRADLIFLAVVSAALTALGARLFRFHPVE